MATSLNMKASDAIIDAHHHLWRYSYAEYSWMGEDPGAPGRDFLGPDLTRLLDEQGVSGTVAVQARESLEENRFLLEQATIEPRIRGIVGWVPFRETNVHGAIEGLAENPLFKGVRHILQGEPDMASFIELETFNAGLETLRRTGLRYDLLVVADQLASTLRLVDRHPDLPMVVDHIAKPLIAGAPDANWARQMREIAQRPNVCCKLSGLVTEVPGWVWTPELLRPYFETVLEAFGPKRLMFGSDWPVCLWASPYGRWLATVREFIKNLSAEEQDWILARSACEFYGLKI
ncbi:MAG TPA: amidohydrolase family protein [Oceanipulchritudo sp.]|nr:amidohydrolase family protein [Oceanipulchritudo sp.]